MCTVCVATAVSPETEVADVLRTIGDRVNEEFGELISQAVAAVWQPVPNDQGVTYAALKAAAENLIARVHPGWSQVRTDHFLHYILMTPHCVPVIVCRGLN